MPSERMPLSRSQMLARVGALFFVLTGLFLGALLASPPGYIGLQGNRKRSARILRELEEEMGPPGEKAKAALHVPAGLDIGAESPEIIALSMISEIQACLSGRPGSCLRDRSGPIH